MIENDEPRPGRRRQKSAPQRFSEPRTEVALSILVGVAIIGVIIFFSVRGCGIPIQLAGDTVTPAASLQTPTFTVTFTQTPALAPTETLLPTATFTATQTPSPTTSPTLSATFSLAASATPTATATTAPSATPTQTEQLSITPALTVSPTMSATLSGTVSFTTTAPTLLNPEAGAKYPNPIAFRWDGPLNEGEAFQVTAWHVKSGERVQTSPMTEREWTYGLHKDLVGEWRWVVWVVKEGQILTTSEEWFFWLDPHEGPGPREFPTRQLPAGTPTPKPTPQT